MGLNINPIVALTNEGFDNPLTVESTDSTDENSDVTPSSEEEEEKDMWENMPAFDEELFGKLANRKSKTSSETLKVISDLNSKTGQSGFLQEYVHDKKLMEKAFFAHEVLCDNLEPYGIDTAGYGLDYDDLENFRLFYERNSKPSDERLRYHIGRVTELGLKIEGKKYISFSYVFSERCDMKYEPV